MKKLKKIFPVAVLTVSIALSGCSKKADEAVSDVFVPVEVLKIEPADIKTELTYAGQIKAKQTADVISKISGEIKEVFFELGDSVNEGDVLFTLDEKSIRDQIRQLEAQLNVSNAGVSAAQTGVNNASGGQAETQKLQLETAVENAGIQVENAKLQLDNAKIQLKNTEITLNDVKTTYENVKLLYDAGAAAKKDFDAAQSVYNQTLLAYEQAQHAVDQATNAYTQAQTAKTQADQSYGIYINQITDETKQTAQNSLASAVASREAVMVQLQIARDTLNDTAVRSPITGVVSAKRINAKDMIGASSVPYSIVDLSSLNVEVNVSERIVNIISVGQNVDVYINSVSAAPLTGIIKNISPAADNTSTYPVKIEIQNDGANIIPGMFTEVRFVREKSDQTIVLPRNTIIENETSRFVYVIEGEAAKKVDVTTGVDNGKEIEIVSGINFGDTVVVKGQNFVSDGEKVRIVNTAEGAKEE